MTVVFIHSKKEHLELNSCLLGVINVLGCFLKEIHFSVLCDITLWLSINPYGRSNVLNKSEKLMSFKLVFCSMKRIRYFKWKVWIGAFSLIHSQFFFWLAKALLYPQSDKQYSSYLFSLPIIALCGILLPPPLTVTAGWRCQGILPCRK